MDEILGRVARALRGVDLTQYENMLDALVNHDIDVWEVANDICMQMGQENFETAVSLKIADADAEGSPEQRIEAQRERSRALSLDGFPEIPPLQVFQWAARTKLQRVDRSSNFVQREETNLRRIAQLCHANFSSLVPLRFCAGGVDVERSEAHRFINHWESSGWKVREAIARMWAGEYGQIGGMSSALDDGSAFVVECIHAMVIVMQIRRLLRDVPELFELSHNLLIIKASLDQEDFQKLHQFLEQTATEAMAKGTPFVVKRDDPNALPVLQLFDEYQETIFSAMGFALQTPQNQYNLTTTERLQGVKMVLSYMQQHEMDSPLVWTPLPLEQEWNEANGNRSFNVRVPDGSRVYHPGDQMDIKWARNPESSVAFVKIVLASAPSAQSAKLSPEIVIERRAPNSGAYQWVVPQTVPDLEYAKISVHNLDNNDDYDLSYEFKINRRRTAAQLGGDGDAASSAAPEKHEEDKIYHRSDFNSEFEYADYMHKKLPLLGPDTRVAYIGSLNNPDLAGLPHEGQGTFLGSQRFDPPVLVAFDHVGEKYVHWHNLSIVSPPPGADPAVPDVQPLTEESYKDQVTHMVSDEDLGPASRLASDRITRLSSMRNASAAEVEISRTSSLGTVVSPSCGQCKCNKHPEGHNVFLSYRRSDGTYFARLIYQYLTSQGYSPFFDFICLAGGSFEHALMTTVDVTPVFVPIITPDYLDEKRLALPKDFVCMELERAVRSRSHFAPIIQEGYKTAFTDIHRIPNADVVTAISSSNATNMVQEFFDAVMRKLMDCINSETHRAPIAMVEPTIRVMTPEENAVLIANEQVLIQLQTTGNIQHVDIMLCRTEEGKTTSATLNTIKKGFPITKDGTVDIPWIVPNQPGAGFQIRVYKSLERSVVDVSFDFTIQPPRDGASTQQQVPQQAQPEVQQQVQQPEQQPQQLVAQPEDQQQQSHPAFQFPDTRTRETPFANPTVPHQGNPPATTQTPSSSAASEQSSPDRLPQLPPAQPAHQPIPPSYETHTGFPTRPAPSRMTSRQPSQPKFNVRPPSALTPPQPARSNLCNLFVTILSGSHSTTLSYPGVPGNTTLQQVRGYVREKLSTDEFDLTHSVPQATPPKQMQLGCDPSSVMLVTLLPEIPSVHVTAKVRQQMLQAPQLTELTQLYGASSPKPIRRTNVTHPIGMPSSQPFRHPSQPQPIHPSAAQTSQAQFTHTPFSYVPAQTQPAQANPSFAQQTMGQQQAPQQSYFQPQQDLIQPSPFSLSQQQQQQGFGARPPFGQ
eukprot:m.9669 g.9669  ORF g.9669 m.9669 type:complete len:1262 (+) comp5482_c0_seq1:150-3935(+)